MDERSSIAGGYCTVDMPFLRYRRSEELLLRWMELNAFSTIFRTHEVRSQKEKKKKIAKKNTLKQTVLGA